MELFRGPVQSLDEVKTLLPDIDMIVVVSKADLMEPRPENWDEVAQSESEWDGEGEPNLPVLLDEEGCNNLLFGWGRCYCIEAGNC